MSTERDRHKHADIEMDAGAKARKVRFDKEPGTKTTFRGEVSRCSFSESQRRNLPEKVRKGVEYRDASIRWKALGWVAKGESDRYEESAKGEVEKPDLGPVED